MLLMMIAGAVVGLIALLLLLLIIGRSPPVRRLRKRVVESDQRYRDSLRPTYPWNDDYRRHW